MTLKTAAERLNVEKSDLEYFVNNGVVGSLGKDGLMLSDKDIDAVGRIALYRQAGLDRETIKKHFFVDLTEEEKTAQIKILGDLREHLLDAVHDKQKLLDKIDYILYGLRHS